MLFENLNDFHPNIKVTITIEVKPRNFSDPQVILNNENAVTKQVHRKKKIK